MPRLDDFEYAFPWNLGSQNQQNEKQSVDSFNGDCDGRGAAVRLHPIKPRVSLASTNRVECLLRRPSPKSFRASV